MLVLACFPGNPIAALSAFSPVVSRASRVPRADPLELAELLPLAISLPLVVLALYAVRKLMLRQEERDQSLAFRNQFLMLGLTLAGIVAVLLTLPVKEKGELLSFFGLILSAALALASTTFIGNILAGIMLRNVGSFRVGDFLRCEGHFGRVTERGLFHTELQTEDRDLTTLPNLYVATHAVSVIRGSGTILSASVSLGYDAPRQRVRELLVQAAERAGLSDPFVLIDELGDYSVSYRAAGLLSDVKEIVTARSRLRAYMLDALHEGGIEIVSPVFMNQRQIKESEAVIPKATRRPAVDEDEAVLEALAFDKAELAENIERLADELAALTSERDELTRRCSESDDEKVRQALTDELERMNVRAQRLKSLVASRQEYLKGLDAQS